MFCLCIFLDRLDFSGQPNLSQWIKTISQQMKALYLLRDEDHSSKSEELCISICENVTLLMKKTQYYGSTTVELRDDRKVARIDWNFSFWWCASATFYNVQTTYRWIISVFFLFFFFVQVILVVQKKWINCNYLKVLDQITNRSMYFIS